MGFKDWLKKFVTVTDDDYIDAEEGNFNDNFDFEPAASAPKDGGKPSKGGSGKGVGGAGGASNVVNINSSRASSNGNKPHVVFQKIDRFADVGEVADVLNEKRIVILNLETCPNDESQRIIDFLYGVAYANRGEFKKVAGRAYIITPYNVPVTGELLDEFCDNSDDF